MPATPEADGTKCERLLADCTSCVTVIYILTSFYDRSRLGSRSIVLINEAGSSMAQVSSFMMAGLLPEGS